MRYSQAGNPRLSAWILCLFAGYFAWGHAWAGGATLYDTGSPDLGHAVLVCTTELSRREAIDRLVAALAGKSA